MTTSCPSKHWGVTSGQRLVLQSVRCKGRQKIMNSEFLTESNFVLCELQKFSRGAKMVLFTQASLMSNSVYLPGYV